MQQVEDIVEDADPRRTRHLGIRDAQTPLQPGEAGASSLECHDLAVHDETGGVLRGERIDQLGVGSVERLAIPRQQPDSLAVAERQAAHSVELALEDPIRVGKAFLGQGGQRRCSPVGHRFVEQHSADGLGQAGEIRHDNSSNVRPDSTDSGRLFTGLRRTSASSSLRFTSNYVSSLPSRIRVSA
jgi:hypothetical protein